MKILNIFQNKKKDDKRSDAMVKQGKIKNDLKSTTVIKKTLSVDKKNKTRKIITIDEDLCNGCGLCIPNCPEGAMKVIDGKARLISDLFCDGLGACVGHCPTGAMKVIERPAEAYDERKVMMNIVKQGKNTIAEHLHHLKSHNMTKYYDEAIDFLKEKKIKIPKLEDEDMGKSVECGCPGAKTMTFEDDNKKEKVISGDVKSQLRQWPVQLHLVNPSAPYFIKKDVVLASDCSAFAYGNFHNDFLKDKSVVIACPKLDSEMESYVEKLTSMMEDSKINSLTVITMEVPCCGGLVSMSLEAKEKSKRKIPIKNVVISLQGKILQDDWI